MSRDEGFAIADVDVGLFDDLKLKKLWRGLRDSGLMCQAVTIFLATLLASWGAGERCVADEATPVWLDPDPEIIAALQAAGLLDAEGRIPEQAWTSWYEPARARRDDARLRGQIGGLMRGLGLTKAQAVAEVARRTSQPTSSPAQAEPNPSVRPSGPTDRPAAARTREDADGSREPPPKEEERPRRRNGVDSGPRPLADVMRGMGLPLPVVVTEPPAEPTR